MRTLLGLSLGVLVRFVLVLVDMVLFYVSLFVLFLWLKKKLIMCVQCLGYMLQIALVLLQHCWFEEI